MTPSAQPPWRTRPGVPGRPGPGRGQPPAGRRAGAAQPGAGQPGPARPLAVTGAIAACTVALVGLVTLTPLVLAGWIAAPHAGLGLPGVLRTATSLWLAAHHAGFSVRGAGRIGMLPLGLVLLPGALLWRAGRWVVRTGEISRLADVGYAALALAGPYAVLSGALALASRSEQAAASLSQAVVAAFLLALCAGGLGGARALAPWGRLIRLLPPRPRSLVLGTAGALVTLTVAGALLAGASLGAHLSAFRSLNDSLQAGPVGSLLLLLAQIAYVPNAVVWSVCFMLGPGFAFGLGTVVAPTGAAVGPLPLFPLLAALPTGPHAAVPGWASAAVLVVPYLAGVVGGVLLVRAAPAPAIETAPLWGFACGAATGCVIGVLAAFSGGPLGSNRLAAVGPSGWQAAVVAALEVGVAAGCAAGLANWLRVRRASALAIKPAGPAGRPVEEGASGHRIFLDPWEKEKDDDRTPPPGPSALP